MPVGGEDRVLSPVVGAKQLVCTIQEVETHEDDPTTEGQDPWNTFQEEFGGLGERLKGNYRRVASEDGPTEEEIKEAFATLAGAWDQIATSVSSALQDPEVRRKLKDAASSLATAVGTTINELGTELRGTESAPEDPPAGDEKL